GDLSRGARQQQGTRSKRMSSKIEVPRGLLANFIEYSVSVAGHCSDWLREKEELRALLAAPVVERQPNKCGQCSASTTDICNQNGCGFLESGNGAPPELAELQAT